MSSSILNCPFYLKITAYELKKSKFNELYDSFKETMADFTSSGGCEVKEKPDNTSSVSSKSSELLSKITDLAISRDVAIIDETPVASFFFPYPNSMFRESIRQDFEQNDFNLQGTILESTMKQVGNLGQNLYETAKKMYARSGGLIDPFTLNVYKTSLPRTIDLGWKIIPESQKQFVYYLSQIEKLRNMSKAKRESINGKQVGISYINIKYVFNIEVIGKFGNTLANELLCCDKPISKEGFFISNFRTTITPNGYQTRIDGTPTDFILDISFIERKPLWRADWEKRLGGSTSSQGNEQITDETIDSKIQ